MANNNQTITRNLGHATAYAFAVAGGYTGTKEEFEAGLAASAEYVIHTQRDALKAEGHAVGTQGGQAVDSESPYYHNNAKWYYENMDGVLADYVNKTTDVDAQPMPNSNKFVTSGTVHEELTALSEEIESINSAAFHICTVDEFDPITRAPTIQSPVTGTTYLVPYVNPESGDRYMEWIYTDRGYWEQYKGGRLDLREVAMICTNVSRKSVPISGGNNIMSVVVEVDTQSRIEVGGKKGHNLIYFPQTQTITWTDSSQVTTPIKIQIDDGYYTLYYDGITELSEKSFTWLKGTFLVYFDGLNFHIDTRGYEATETRQGFMSARDKMTLDSISNLKGIYFVNGTHRTATNEWTGVLEDVDELTAGLTIAYRLPYNGTETAAKLKLTLANGVETPWRSIYMGAAGSVTNQYMQGAVLILTYYDNSWQTADYYDESVWTGGTGFVDSQHSLYLIRASISYFRGDYIPGEGAIGCGLMRFNTTHTYTNDTGTTLALRFQVTRMIGSMLRLYRIPLVINGKSELEAGETLTIPVGSYLVKQQDVTEWTMNTNGTSPFYVSIGNATTTTAGLMSAADKTKLDSISNDIGDIADTVVIVSDEEPDEEHNKLWIDETGDSEITLFTEDDADELIIVSDTEPDEEHNKLWIDPDQTEHQVPTMSDLNARVPDPTSAGPNKFLKTDSNGDAEWGDGVSSAEIIAAVDDWLDTNITNPDSPPLDRSLSSSSAAAPADLVGDQSEEIDNLRKSTENEFEQVTGNRALIFRPGLFKCFANGSSTIDIDTPITGTTVADDTMTTISPCSPGDVFHIRAYGGAETACAYGFLNSSKAGISRGGESQLFEGNVTATTNAAYIIVNNNITNNPTNFYAYKGCAIKDKTAFIQQIVEELRTPDNIFTVEDITDGKYLRYSDDTLSTNSAYSVSDYISVVEGFTYIFPIYTSLFGTSGNELKQHFYDSNKTALSLTVGKRDSGLITVTAPKGAAYIRVTVKNTDLDTFMLICGAEYPSSYIAPGDIYLKSNVIAQKITDEAITFVSVSGSIENVYDPNDADIEDGKVVSYNGTITSAQGFKVSGYIPIAPGATYLVPRYTMYFGSSDLRYLPCYDATKTYAGNLDRTSNDLTYFRQYTFPANTTYKYFRVPIATYDANSNRIVTPYHSESCFMVMKGTTTLPGKFIPYGTQYKFADNYHSASEGLSNPLYNKNVVFLGDSICEASTDDYGGFAGRIGMNNSMLWENAGVGGSTITNATGVGAGKYICIKTFTMSNPDYIILEGGTNDADRIGDAIGSAKPEDFGTYDPDEYGTDDAETYYGFDIDTFCGACDYMFKRFVSTYPGAKIGFVGAHKMGQVLATRKNRGVYIQTAMDIAKKWGVPCLDLWNGCYLNPMIPSHYTANEDYMYADGQHLKPKGYAYISKMIESWMKTL